VRSEWERSVKSDVPVIGDDTPLLGVLGDEVNAIDRAFEVRVERKRWNVDVDNVRIEMVLDRGVVAIEERNSPISEIELELLSG
ncbi:CYTH domain-containing protein, partial [Aestuariibaculum lutulentum]|nr:hypothetical protein [Aestuariibaculum lutulentum]